jgi:hypothetical protein
MWTAAALWDVLAKAANLAQMTVMLVAVFASLLRLLPRSKRECAELERCSRRLRELLQWPTGCGLALLCSEMGGPVVEALGDAARLVDAYHGSTLWRRVWSAGGTAAHRSATCRTSSTPTTASCFPSTHISCYNSRQLIIVIQFPRRRILLREIEINLMQTQIQVFFF